MSAVGERVQVPFPKVVDRQDLITGRLHYVAMATVINYHQLGGLKQHESYDFTIL